ncbi:MAG: RHS repeat domain-containing protein [Terriglobia bacterium]
MDIDHLGSSTMVSEHTGTVTQKTLFYPFGQLWLSAGSAVTRRFASLQEPLPNGGPEVYAAPFRQYQSRLYRWLSPDPLAGDISNTQSLNRYAYVMNNPMNLMDPLGLKGCHQDDDCPQPDDGETIDTDDLPGSGPTPGGSRPGGGRGGAGGGRGAEPLDVSKTWQDTFPCSESATDLMSDFKSNMARFADNSGPFFAAQFPTAPIVQGQSYLVIPGVSTRRGDFLPTGVLEVKVTSQTANSWTFTTNPQQHYINGTVTFMASDAGNGNVNFVVTANGNFTSFFNKYVLGSTIRAGEDSTWNNLLNNVKGRCALGGVK